MFQNISILFGRSRSTESRSTEDIDLLIPKQTLSKFTELWNRLLKEERLFISPLEMQIAYKLFLGSEKDLEDAKHIYELFKEDLNTLELNKLIEQLKVKNNFTKIK